MCHLPFNVSVCPTQAAELDVAERADLQRLRARLEHQLSLGPPRPEHALEWERSRIDRLIVDYLLRAGYQKSALELAKATDSLVRARREGKRGWGGSAQMARWVVDAWSGGLFSGCRGALVGT